MKVLVVDGDGKSIKAVLRSYDAAGDLVGEEDIPVGGADISEIDTAVGFRFEADGYQDATITDLYSYQSMTMEMIPKYKWVVPAAVAALAILILSKTKILKV